jgi:hypothetical protein
MTASLQVQQRISSRFPMIRRKQSIFSTQGFHMRVSSTVGADHQTVGAIVDKGKLLSSEVCSPKLSMPELIRAKEFALEPTVSHRHFHSAEPSWHWNPLFALSHFPYISDLACQISSDNHGLEMTVRASTREMGPGTERWILSILSGGWFGHAETHGTPCGQMM